MKIFNLPLLSVVFVSIFLIACSGGSTDSDNNQERAKVIVNAGSDKTVDEASIFTLNAQASGQTTNLTYTWSVTPNIDITHIDTSTGSASVTAPITAELLTYTFTVVVVDEEGNRGTDQVMYSVSPVNILPTAVLTVPKLENLAINQFPAGEIVTLDGSGSFDSDGAANTLPIAEYVWQQTAGEPVLDGISVQGHNLSFTTPILVDENNLSFSLTVKDQEGGEHTQSVDILVQSANQTLPNVEAGSNHEVFSGESINLYGVASTNVAASRPLSALWLNDSDTSPIIGNKNSLQTYAVAPAVIQEEAITFTLEVQDAQGNQVEDSITVTIKPLPLQPLNDTGVYQQTSNSQFFSEHLGDFPGQDGQRGQDIIHAHNLSAKAGRGDQGFDFTKLDAVGDEVDDPAQPWSCVRDNITGLIWEVKTLPTATDLHSSSHSYTWYQEEDNGEFEGDITGSAASCGLTECNTTEYLTQVNAQGLCNFRDWRLPTHEELLSIVHFGRVTSPMVDVTYFPNATDSLTAPVWYWTQDSSADGISSIGAQNAWSMDFASGNDNFLDKSTAARIRLVRAGR
jgi:hypothetical protein